MPLSGRRELEGVRQRVQRRDEVLRCVRHIRNPEELLDRGGAERLPFGLGEDRCKEIPNRIVDPERVLSHGTNQGLRRQREEDVVRQGGIDECGLARKRHLVERGGLHHPSLPLRQLRVDLLLDEAAYVGERGSIDSASRRGPEELDEQGVSPELLRDRSETASVGVRGQQRGDVVMAEAFQVDFLHDVADRNVSSIVERRRPPRQDDRSCVGRVRNRIFQEPQEVEDLRNRLMGVVENEDATRRSEVVSQDRVRADRLAAREDRPQARPTGRREEIAEAREHGRPSVPRTDLVPVRVVRRLEFLARLRREARLPDPGDAPDHEDAGLSVLLRDGVEFVLAADERVEARRFRKAHHGSPGRGRSEDP